MFFVFIEFTFPDAKTLAFFRFLVLLKDSSTAVSVLLSLATYTHQTFDTSQTASHNILQNK